MLLNSILFFVSILLCFGLLFLAKKLFGKAGLYVWIVIATILANIETLKIVSMLGFNDVVLGTVSFASVFLAGDILAVCYGYKASKKGVYIGLFTSIAFLILIQLTLLFIPSSIDYIDESLKMVFGLDSVYIWVTLASILMFFLSNLLNVYLFDRLRNKLKDRKLWVVSNVSTIIANCFENFCFVLLGYYLLQLIFTGNTIYDFVTCLVMAGTTSLMELVIAIFGTPFLYLAKSKLGKEIEWEKN